MTTQIIDFSEIDLTGGLRWNGEVIGAAHYNGERLWPFGVDLLYTGGIGGASYLPDTGAVFADTAAATPATFGGSIARTNPAGGAGNALQASASLRPLLGRAPKSRRNLLVNTDALATQGRVVTNVAHTLSFKGTGSVARSGASTGTLAGTGANDRVSVTFTPSAGTLTLTVSGSVTEAQLEIGSAVTPYQRVGVATDITEAGVPSYPFIRLDLSDDRLDTVLPQAVTGDVVIAGRNGSWIEARSFAAGATFSLGPTGTIPTPGILRAIGDVVGWSILGKTLTAAERERLMRFYKRRGAKGLLVPGPELVTNGTFDTGIAPWFLVGSGAVAWNPAGTMQISDVGGNDGRARLHVDVTPGAPYLVAYDVRTTQQFLLAWGDRGSGSNNGQVTDTFSTGGVFQRFSRVVLFTAAASSITLFQAGTDVTGEVDNVSIRELRPEEDW